MSTTPKYSRLDPGQRREQILDAANALFAERGYDEVSIEDIASAAGVTRGLVHHYFGGRKEVYIGLLERLGAQREEQLPPPVGRSARARVARHRLALARLDRGEPHDLARHDRARRGHRRPRRQARRRRPRTPRRRAARRSSRRHRRGHAAAALRARVLDRAEPRRDATLAATATPPARRHTSCSPRRWNTSCAPSAPRPRQASTHPQLEPRIIDLHARQRPTRWSSSSRSRPRSSPSGRPRR